MNAIILATAFALTAPPAEDKGWELKIELAKPGEPIFVGENGEDVPITVTLKNTTDKERGHVPASRVIKGKVLEANILLPDGKVMRSYAFPGYADNFKDLIPLAANKSATYAVTPAQFAYRNFRTNGKHTIQMKYVTPDGIATSNTITLDVINPDKADILARAVIPPGERELQNPVDERDSAYVDQVKVGDKVYLVYREYVGAKWGGECGFAKRLDTLPGKVEMIVVGAHGSRLPNGWERFFVSYGHKKNAMTTLRIQSVGCEIEERLVFEADKDDEKETGELFKDCKFALAADVPPEKLRLTYAAFVASVKTGGQGKFCLHSVEISDKADPKRGDTASGMNIPWMKEHFPPNVFSCRKDPDDTFLIRTGSSYLYWVQTRSGEWKIFKYGDKPIQ